MIHGMCGIKVFDNREVKARILEFQYKRAKDPSTLGYDGCINVVEL